MTALAVHITKILGTFVAQPFQMKSAREIFAQKDEGQNRQAIMLSQLLSWRPRAGRFSCLLSKS